jgi:phage terminase Nu1 subunit (DNA packaging protein)
VTAPLLKISDVLPTLLTGDQLAAMLQVDPATLRKYRRDKRHPLPSTGNGTGRRYDLEQVRAWLAARARQDVAIPAAKVRTLTYRRVHF